jgi:two-component system sensor histidine kinase AgrC
LGRYAKKHFRSDVFKHYFKLTTLILIEIFLAVFIVIVNIDYGRRIGYPPSTILHNCVLFGLYFLISILLLLNLLRTTKRNMEIAQKEVEYSQLLDYIRDLEQTSLSLRKFRHDYLNILLSLDLLIHAGDHAELIRYFDANIKPQGYSISGINTEFSNLARIAEPAIKGIVSHKLQMARLQNIEVKVEAAEEIDSFFMEPFDLARILGLFLDNAIEAASLPEDGFLEMVFARVDTHLLIQITNSCIAENLPLERLEEEGFSTKGPGHGHGLSQVREILERYPNVDHTTCLEGGRFIQALHLFKTKEQKEQEAVPEGVVTTYTVP